MRGVVLQLPCSSHSSSTIIRKAMTQLSSPSYWMFCCVNHQLAVSSCQQSYCRLKCKTKKPWSYLCSLREQSYFQGPPRTIWSGRPLCLQWCNAHTYSVCVVVEDHEVTIADIEAWQVVTGVLGIKDVFIYDISCSSCFRRVPSMKKHQTQEIITRPTPDGG